MRREAGFTLLEMLVALTILAVAIAAVFSAFASSAARTRETQSRMTARNLAAALLTQAEIAPALSYGETHGRLPSGMEWRFDVRRYGDAKDAQAWLAAAAEMTATVRWGDESGQTFTLRSLRLLPKERTP
jgi:general secretion pathway protein I